MSEAIYIFMDDVRDPPDDGNPWIVVRDAHMAWLHINVAISIGISVVASLDHDLGEDTPTGYDMLNWLERRIVTGSKINPNTKLEFKIHSANPVGRDNMTRAIGAIKRLLQ